MHNRRHEGKTCAPLGANFDTAQQSVSLRRVDTPLHAQLAAPAQRRTIVDAFGVSKRDVRHTCARTRKRRATCQTTKPENLRCVRCRMRSRTGVTLNIFTINDSTCLEAQSKQTPHNRRAPHVTILKPLTSPPPQYTESRPSASMNRISLVDGDDRLRMKTASGSLDYDEPYVRLSCWLTANQ